MEELRFKIVRMPYPAASKLRGEIVQKVRDDGRAGPVVGDEALLWDALQEALKAGAELWDQLQSANCRLTELEYAQALLSDERGMRLAAEKERDELRRQLEGKRGKR